LKLESLELFFIRIEACFNEVNMLFQHHACTIILDATCWPPSNTSLSLLKFSSNIVEHSSPNSPLSFKNHTFKQFLLKSDEVNSTQKLSVTGKKLAKNLNAMRREQQRHKCEWIEKIHEIGSPSDVSSIAFQGWARAIPVAFTWPHPTLSVGCHPVTFYLSCLSLFVDPQIEREDVEGETQY
jgi:hypothetical protein